MLTDETFWAAVGNTVQLLLFSVPVTVVLALAVAIGLDRISSLTWRNVWASMYFLPFATSLVAAALIWQWIYEPVYGFLNYALSYVGIPPHKWLQSLGEVKPSIAAVSVWVRIGFDTMIFLAALQSVSQDAIDAANIDGANALQRFFYVTLPEIRPVVGFVVLLSVIGSLQLFELPFVLLGGSGPERSGLTLVMYLYQNGFERNDLGFASAIGWTLAIILLGARLIQRKVSTDE